MTKARPSWLGEVEERLASPPPQRLAPSEARQSAVLVLLYVDAGELWTILTQRAETLPHHRGQIAFPGGANEAGEDVWSAALRETEEEIGVSRSLVLRLGALDEISTPSGFRIVPCVGAIPKNIPTTPSAAEIADVFAAPISALANPVLAEEREVLLNGQRRRLRIYHYGGRQIWGATARILQNLLDRLGIGSTLEPLDEPG